MLCQGCKWCSPFPCHSVDVGTKFVRAFLLAWWYLVEAMLISAVSLGMYASPHAVFSSRESLWKEKCECILPSDVGAPTLLYSNGCVFSLCQSVESLCSQLLHFKLNQYLSPFITYKNTAITSNLSITWTDETSYIIVRQSLLKVMFSYIILSEFRNRSYLRGSIEASSPR